MEGKGKGGMHVLLLLRLLCVVVSGISSILRIFTKKDLTMI